MNNDEKRKKVKTLKKLGKRKQIALEMLIISEVGRPEVIAAMLSALSKDKFEEVVCLAIVLGS